MKKYAFLSSIAGEYPEEDLPDWLARNARLKKYLFYEFIDSVPKLCCDALKKEQSP